VPVSLRSAWSRAAGLCLLCSPPKNPPPTDKIPHSFLRMSSNDSGRAASWEEDFEMHDSYDGDKKRRWRQRQRQRRCDDEEDEDNGNSSDGDELGECDDDSKEARAKTRSRKRARYDSPSSLPDYDDDERYVVNFTDLAEMEGWDVSSFHLIDCSKTQRMPFF
jgi:hypothetical protein